MYEKERKVFPSFNRIKNNMNILFLNKNCYELEEIPFGGQNFKITKLNYKSIEYSDFLKKELEDYISIGFYWQFNETLIINYNNLEIFTKNEHII